MPPLKEECTHEQPFEKKDSNACYMEWAAQSGPLAPYPVPAAGIQLSQARLLATAGI